MALDKLSEIVVNLLVVAQTLTGYGPPAEPPTVALISHGELEQAACDRPCEVYGWYPFGATVYLDDRLDPLRDIRARAILLHELVHYLQNQHGAFADQPACVRWAMREREAYLVQARWLAKHRVKFRMPVAGARPWKADCAVEASATVPDE